MVEENRTLFILAPLAGYTDKAFREIAYKHGADAAVTEMVSAEGLARSSDKTKELLSRFDGEEKLIVQLFGSELSSYERAIDSLMSFSPSQIDVNAGCPVPKVVKTGAGSAMMRDIDNMVKIVSFLKSATNLPISIKFRLGWDEKTINYLEFADAAVDAGADSLTLHARTRAQGYSGTADRNAFTLLRSHIKNPNIKIYASGDIFSAEDALNTLKSTGVDGIMFARGAIGNPFIFNETKSLLNNGSYTEPAISERVAVAIEHYDLMVKYYGEALASREMRKHIMAYIKGLKGSKETKLKIGSASKREEYIAALSSLL